MTHDEDILKRIIKVYMNKRLSTTFYSRARIIKEMKNNKAAKTLTHKLLDEALTHKILTTKLENERKNDRPKFQQLTNIIDQRGMIVPIFEVSESETESEIESADYLMKHDDLD